MFAIKTEKLTKFYGQARGIVEVDLQVPQGDFFGFIGPNGAGKSTLIRTLLGLIAPTGGKAEILGRDCIADKLDNLRDIGYLPSETALYRGMRVRDILALSAKLRHLDCTEAASDLAARLGLDITRKIEELSFGNRKKVGLVCALQHDPKLYILDEPTSGLDPLAQKEFFAILEERNRAGATVFLSSHVLPEIARHCKHAAVIREGRLLVCDSVSSLAHTGVKRVILRGITAPPVIEQARNMQFNENAAQFLFSGTPTELLHALSALQFSDFSVTDPELDEIFLHYYAKEMP
ncbi:MAG: ABC transporter ATP-binding protein [Ruminococcaceae bacterium]|nr:ABC transporter ATP-binding protein [Oscillospiraceae bacterium]